MPTIKAENIILYTTSDCKYCGKNHQNFNVNFHGYKILWCGTILNKKGKPLKPFLNKRRGGNQEPRVSLYINGKPKKFLVSRLVCASFQGPLYGYQVNHIDRDILNCNNNNLERVTQSENQRHWRNCDVSI